MSKLLLEGGRVVDPTQDLDATRDLLLVDGRVADLGDGIEVGDDVEVVDVAGLVVTPGLVDMHVHFREPGQEHKETIASGVAAAAAGGFTAVACMPNTEPVNDNRSVTEFIVEQAEELDSVAVHPIGAVSLGQRGEELAEMGEMLEGGCVAFSDDGYPVATAELMRRALEYTRMFEVPVIEHCEEMSLTRDAAMHEGEVSTALGLKGHPGAAEEIIVARDVVLAELTGGRLHCAHLSSAGSLRQIRDARERGLTVTCEVTPHHFTLTDEAVRGFDTQTKMNPPLRGREDVDAVLEGLADGTIDAIATDHAPHHADEKALEFDLAPFGIVGLETAVPLACERLLHGGVVDLPRLVELMSTNPARVLGLDGGTLIPGSPADVTVLDPELSASVEPDRFRSKSTNTPFAGRELRGWPVMTVVSGRVVWEREDRE